MEKSNTKEKTRITKSNELVNARYGFSIREQRLFLKMLTQIDETDEDFRPYKIRISEFIQQFGIRSNDAHAQIEASTDRMLRKIIKIPFTEDGKQKVFKTTLVSSFAYNRDGTGFIEASFHPKLKPYLLQLKSKYLQYDIRCVMRLSSSHSLRMYELLKQYERIGERSFWLGELKELLGLEEKYGARYYNFKKKVLLPAQKELQKHTDMYFDFTELKGKNRAVEKLHFRIYLNQPPAEAVAGKVQQKLQQYGIAWDKVLETSLKQRPEAVIVSVIAEAEAHMKSGKKSIQHPGAYLRGWLENPKSFRQAMQKMQQLQHQKNTEEVRQQQETLKRAFETELQAKIQQLRAQYWTPELAQEVLKSQQQSILYSKFAEAAQHGKPNAMRQAIGNQYLMKTYLKPEEYVFEHRQAARSAPYIQQQ